MTRTFCFAAAAVFLGACGALGGGDVLTPDRIKADLLGRSLGTCLLPQSEQTIFGNSQMWSFGNLEEFLSFDVQEAEDTEFVRQRRIHATMQDDRPYIFDAIFLTVYRQTDGNWELVSVTKEDCTMTRIAP